MIQPCYEATVRPIPAHVAREAELKRLLRVFYEASSHYQNEDGGCDCDDCQAAVDALQGKVSA